MKRKNVLILLFLGCVALGCDNNTTAPPAQLCMEFSAAGAPQPGAVTADASADSTCAVAEVELLATDVMDAFGVNTTVRFNENVVSFIRMSTTGSALAADGVSLTFVAREVAPGRIELGIARVSSTGIDLNGTNVLATLEFVGVPEEGTTNLSLEDECVLGSESPPQPKVGLSCTGGTFDIEGL